MTEQLPLQGPFKTMCGCGCGLYGALRRRPWRSGITCVRLCQCRSCQGSRTKRNAAKRERSIAKDIGGYREIFSGQLSGADVTGVCDVEETSNQSVTRGMKRWWESKGVQTKVARLMARTSDAPRALVLTWDGRRRVVVMTYEHWRQLAQTAKKAS